MRLTETQLRSIISETITEASSKNPTPEQIEPVIDQVFDAILTLKKHGASVVKYMGAVTDHLDDLGMDDSKFLDKRDRVGSVVELLGDLDEYFLEEMTQKHLNNVKSICAKYSSTDHSKLSKKSVGDARSARDKVYRRVIAYLKNKELEGVRITKKVIKNGVSSYGDELDERQKDIMNRQLYFFLR